MVQEMALICHEPKPPGVLLLKHTEQAGGLPKLLAGG